MTVQLSIYIQRQTGMDGYDDWIWTWLGYGQTYYQ